MGERQFSEEQVADIIRRAAEAQSRQGKPLLSSSGMITVAEVRRIAGELGIDPAALEGAIDETANWRASDTGSLHSVDRTLERQIEGELAEADYSAVLEEFVPSSGPGGQSILVGSTLNYKAMVGFAECNVNVSKKSGKTNLRVKSSAFLALLPTVLPAFVATVVSGGIVWESRSLLAFEKLATHLGIVALVGVLAYWGFRSLVRYSNQKIADLLDRTTSKVAELNASNEDPVHTRLAPTGQIELTTEESVHIQQ